MVLVLAQPFKLSTVANLPRLQVTPFYLLCISLPNLIFLPPHIFLFHSLRFCRYLISLHVFA